MKHKLFTLLFCGFFVVIFSLVFFNRSKADAPMEPLGVVPRPYVVEIINQNGSTGELKGLSESQDAFSISQDLGAEPFPEDRLSVFPDIKLDIGGKITLTRAPVFTLHDGRKTSILRSWQGTVGGLLAEKNVELGTDDKINFAIDMPTEDGMEITIIRVAITNVVEHEGVDFSIVKKEDKTLDEGKTRIDQAGVAGVRTKTYLVTREDGVEVSRKLLSNEITTKPVDQILVIGTKPVITVRCKFNDTVLAASMKYGVKPNDICNLMMKESNGNYNSVNPNGYYGLFQYEKGFWASISAKAGYGGADIFDATAQIYTTAYAWSHGYQGRW